ncbi:hypothetical protein ID866_2674, partial [Astraeus odoratus]
MGICLLSRGLIFASLLRLAFAGAVYTVCDTIEGHGFYDAFNFEAIADPTHGRVNYVDCTTAKKLGLTVATSNSFILRADDKTILSPNGPGRNSVRIRSNKAYTTHVAIFDVNHMPEGCGLAASDDVFLAKAIWETFEADWPDSGEVDIVEGVNNIGPNQAHLHTGPNCSIPETIDQLGTVLTTNCDAAVNYNSGCGSSFNYAPKSFGPEFNQAGGGWFAVERTNEHISVWYWGRQDWSTPIDVRIGSYVIDTSRWGTPSAYFPNTDCDIASHFGPNNIIIDLTFCGDWAGSPSIYNASGCPSTCVDFVNNNPEAFSGAYFQFSSILCIGPESHKSAVPQRIRLKKDPGIPKLPDLKHRNVEKQKTHTVCDNSDAHLSTDPDADAVMASEPTLSSLAILASTAQEEYDGPPSSASGPSQKTKEQMRRHYVRALHKVIDESDIIVLVLDARDPEGCRSRLVEEEVRRRESEGKRLVFVLNKIDLVPRENAQQWLRFLRHSTPTLPFRSTASNQRSNLSSATAPALLRLLKAYKPTAQSITVGVVGFPNVGKSSLINSLKRSKVCAVAARAGHTKELQTVQLERGIKIIDSPGVVFDEENDDQGTSSGRLQKGSVLLRNVIKVEDVQDPIAVVEEILSRTESGTLQRIYNLPEFSSTLEFLTMFALSSGRLLKGGTPDVLSAARQVLMDWNQQKIPYFSVPPM